MLKLAHLYMFPRRRTNGTFAAPPVGKYISSKVDVSMNINITPRVLQSAENCLFRLSTFSVKGDQILDKNAKTALRRFSAKFSKSDRVSLLDREIRLSFDLEYLGRRTSYYKKI